MKIRSSERNHYFQSMLFRRLRAFSLQGLLMDDDHNFTAAIEAIAEESSDDKRLFPYSGSNVVFPFSSTNTAIPFTEEELHAKYILATEIGVPFYIICYSNGLFTILEVKEKDGSIGIKKSQKFTEQQFIDWWKQLKGTIQTKQLNNGGEARLCNTVFDSVLRKYGLEWGGNIDGFSLNEDGSGIRCIIDNISVSRPGLNDDPSNYFNSPNPRHGPRYEGWYAAVKLAHDLGVPHVLFTLDKNNDRIEHTGIAFIRRLSPEGLFYVKNIKTNDNIRSGMDNIVDFINRVLPRLSPPELIEKTEN